MAKVALSVYFDTLPPEAISDELAPTIDELGLWENCRELAMNGWTVIENVAEGSFNQRFRKKIKEMFASRNYNMLLAKDDLFSEAVLNPKLLAMAEFSVGRGFLLSQVAASVRPKDAGALGLHADNNWIPAPFPAHNMLLTGCWACDEFTKENGSTLVIPGSHVLKRHPTAQEIQEKRGAIAIECPPGSVAMWDGSIWHGNWERKTEGSRVVCHITYTRLMMRPVEDYTQYADGLVEKFGERMAQLLGRQDSLNGPNGFEYDKLLTTFNNAKR
ncbi:MAG: phytanoyl-CoA dioxygenase family protein [Gammaproteobacteria bacterium]|nr:phytanoyl-CoA dioxygenase family protein [Gammaproteobacteria bacterium]